MHGPRARVKRGQDDGARWSRGISLSSLFHNKAAATPERSGSAVDRGHQKKTTRTWPGEPEKEESGQPAARQRPGHVRSTIRTSDTPPRAFSSLIFPMFSRPSISFSLAPSSSLSRLRNHFRLFTSVPPILRPGRVAEVKVSRLLHGYAVESRFFADLPTWNRLRPEDDKLAMRRGARRCVDTWFRALVVPVTFELHFLPHCVWFSKFDFNLESLRMIANLIFSILFLFCTFVVDVVEDIH